MTVAETTLSWNTQRRSWATPAAIFATFALAAIPFFLVAMPPVMDFPNHLTRIWLLSGGADHRPLSAIYEVRWWQTSTNILVDLISTALARIMPLESVGRLLLLTMFLGPPLAAAFLNRALYGRFHVWQLAGVAIIWSTTSVTGLISYQIGLAAALVMTMLVQPMLAHPTPKRFVLIGLAASLLLVIHPFGALFFLILTTGLAIGERIPWPLPRAWLMQRSQRIALLAAVCVVPVICLFLFSPHPPGAAGTHKEFMHWEPLKDVLSPKNIAIAWFSPFLAYKAALDLIVALPIIGIVVYAAHRKHLRLHAGLMVLAAGLLFISPFLPMNIGDGGAFTIRFPEMAALIALAALRPDFHRRSQMTMAAILVAVALFRIASISWIWLDRAQDVEDLKMTAAKLPPGASVLVLQKKWKETSDLPLGRLVAGFPGGRCASERHFASLAVMWQHVFIPTLFTVPGQQPLGVKPPWKAKSVYSSGIPFSDDMSTKTSQKFDPYLHNWNRKFDYVLLLDADFGAPKLPGAHVVAGRGFAKLYQVDKNWLIGASERGRTSASAVR